MSFPKHNGVKRADDELGIRFEYRNGKFGFDYTYGWYSFSYPQGGIWKFFQDERQTDKEALPQVVQLIDRLIETGKPPFGGWK